MLRTVRPEIHDLWFKEKMLSDPDTMSYNHAFGGTIPFPPERQRTWYERWIVNGGQERFYRYLADEAGKFVGEIAYHWDGERNLFLADVLIYAPERGKGFGREGLRLLCGEARSRGVRTLCDSIAADNPALPLFLSEGFSVVSRTDEFILLQKNLTDAQP